MPKIFKMFIFYFLVIFFVLLTVVFCYFFVGKTSQAENITWGVDFSQKQVLDLKLDWKKMYSSMLSDLNVKNIKLHTQWDLIETSKNDYFFDDTDWQLAEAKKNNAKIIYVLGLKTGRWPECHTPKWAEGLSKQQQQDQILKYVKETVLRYKDDKTISFWQVENEPFFNFGICPTWYYKENKDFVKKEADLVRSLDTSRQIIISDSGEMSTWFLPAKIGDIVGTTMYRKSWTSFGNLGFSNSLGFYGTYPLPAVFYARKAGLVNFLYHKKVICVELQAEPWASKPFYDNISLAEQDKTMDLSQFKSNIAYAKNTGLDAFYLWGVEWWYWMKETQNRPEIWNEARNLF